MQNDTAILGSGPIKEVLAASPASVSAVSFPSILQWPGTQVIVTGHSEESNWRASQHSSDDLEWNLQLSRALNDFRSRISWHHPRIHIVSDWKTVIKVPRGKGMDTLSRGQ